MNNKIFSGVITAQQEFLYPDTQCHLLPDVLHIATAKNGMRNIQLLIETTGENVRLSLEADFFTPEWYQMIAIPVGYNTGDGEEQGGAMILEERPTEKPAYTTRLAPFDVFDCLRPRENGVVPVQNGKAAACITLKPHCGVPEGKHSLVLHIDMAQGRYSCAITVDVYNVEIPKDDFPITYWFSIEDICRFHKAEYNSPAYFAVLKKYIAAMRRVRQNTFLMLLDERCVSSRAPYMFDFEYLTPTIEQFFDGGMVRMEIGHLLSRGYKPDGSKDMYSGIFKCAMAHDVPVNSFEGYAITVKYVQQLGEYLKNHGWLEKTLFHIHDEPDIHVENEVAMETRKRDYQLAGNILRKYIPGARVIEATKSTLFRGSIDVLVPDTAGFEAYRAEFEQLAEMGHEVWSYVCCGPEGHWLNRFLDYAVLKDRLLFWGFAKNKISGFLQWGFNQFPDKMNPFIATECPNDTGIGTNFPCGDSFMVYPGDDGPWIGTRFEAWR
ncbi:MAG: DUF4091 domain-containing protein, partial [Oscillospiraceae bacterium]